MRITATIVFLVTMATLQFGTMASYMACRWKAIITEKNCDCDDLLMAKFSFQPTDQNTAAPAAIASVTSIDHLLAFASVPEWPLGLPKFVVTILLVDFVESLEKGYCQSPVKPPAVV